MAVKTTTLADTGQLLAEQSFLAGQVLPLRRELAVLFVDMVDSTTMLFSHDTERVLQIVQKFMQVDVAENFRRLPDSPPLQGLEQTPAIWMA